MQLLREIIRTYRGNLHGNYRRARCAAGALFCSRFCPILISHTNPYSEFDLVSELSGSNTYDFIIPQRFINALDLFYALSGRFVHSILFLDSVDNANCCFPNGDAFYHRCANILCYPVGNGLITITYAFDLP